MEKKPQILSIIVLPSTNILHLATPTIPEDIQPHEDPHPVLVEHQQVDDQILAKPLSDLPKSEPTNPEPPNTEPPDDDDALTKEDFYKIMENFKKESLELFKQKLTALSS